MGWAANPRVASYPSVADPKSASLYHPTVLRGLISASLFVKTADVLAINCKEFV